MSSGRNFSDSSEELSDGDNEVIQDLYKSKSGAKLRRISNLNNLSESNSDSELEQNDSSDEGAYGKNSEYKEQMDFVVDEDGNSIEIIHHRVSAASTRHDEKDLSNAWKLFPTMQNVVEGKTRQLRALSIDTASNEPLPDVFERECDRCHFKSAILKQNILSQWIITNYFKARIPDDQYADDMDEESELAKTQIQILNNLLLAVFKQNNAVLTPQHVKNCLPDLYVKPDSIFDLDDIYKIQTACKKYEWILKDRGNIIKSAMEQIAKYKDEKYYDFMNNILKCADNALAFKDFRTYIQIHNENPVKENALFHKRSELFGKFTDEFLLNPSALAMKLDNDEKSTAADLGVSDPPEPLHPPDIRFSQFFEENPDYQESCNLQAGNDLSEAEREVKAKEILKKHLVQFASKDLSTNPFLLNSIREIIRPLITVSTEPTETGEESPLMLPYGKYGIVKRIKNKLTVSFESSDKWLIIEEAERRGLLKVKFDIINGGIDNFFESLKHEYVAQYSSLWDPVREEILRQAFYEEIWPQMIDEARSDLFTKSATFVQNCVEERLYSYLTAPPYTKRSSADDLSLQTCSILSYCYHPDYPKDIGMAHVSPNGHVESWFVFMSAALQSKENPTEEEKATIANKSAQDAETEFRRIFKSSSPPELIVICATSLKSLLLYKFIRRFLYNIQKETTIPIIFAPSDAAIIYARSELSSIERHELSQQRPVHDLVLIAASTARRVQNPLSELTRLASPQHNFLVDLSYHPFQSRFIEKGVENGVIHEACEKACLRAVALTGIDLSLLISPHHRGPLQFIPGFGPIYAEFILNSTVKSSSSNISNRLQIYKILEHQQNVYKNAISFLRIPAHEISHESERSKKKDKEETTDETIEFLDGTLIHPDYYDKAKNLINFLLGKQFEENRLENIDIQNFYREQTQDTMTKEKINEFYEENKIPEDEHHLYEFIISELSIGPFESLRFQKRDRNKLYPIYDPSVDNKLTGQYESLRYYREWRDKICYMKDNFYCPLDDEELFDFLVNDETLKENSCCDFKIRKVFFKDRLIIITAIHSTGLIANAQHDINTPDFPIRETDEKTLQNAAILHINKQQMTIDISFDPADIIQMQSYDRIKQDIEEDFDLEGERFAQIEAERRKRERPNPIQPRIINDENFMNITNDEAVRYLLSMPVGKFIFRPSSKGTDHITLMIKFPGDVIANYDIVEREKKSNNELMIGGQLWIEDMCFEDLEEINWNFVHKINEKVQAAMKHRKWIENYDTAVAAITSERHQNPKAAAYRLTVNPNNPEVSNCIIFLWLDKQGRQIPEPIRITPNAYRYRHRNYYNLEHIINDWKSNKFALPSNDELRPHSLKRAKTEKEEREENEERYRSNQYGRQ
ncbi:transcription elongation factor SPT6 [Histomonas meleagridis]|uniref:transcription elongation factor SPT6-like n=1 Tax=Histomonas meleagridis TaxID=135588 RepID=UPI00355A7C13|nr:transcription elongation factor SPT6 [Histomonas meleagridis]KAH0799447.1 transcription elongation factor SPT6-like [Histomonas meleagridis]